MERSLSGIQRLSATGGELIYSVNGKKVFVSEVTSAIWNESAIRGVRYRRFHCITTCKPQYDDFREVAILRKPYIMIVWRSQTNIMTSRNIAWKMTSRKSYVILRLASRNIGTKKNDVIEQKLYLLYYLWFEWADTT